MYWIGGISELCHEFLERTSTTTGFVSFYPLTPFTRKTLKAVILNRHRRSGLEITFEPSKNPSTLMRQRLSRADSDEDRQEIIRKAFFERLFKLADQNLRLALFYWMRSLRFDPDSESVFVEWPKQLDFDFLSGLNLQRVFSLRSFLFHQTLTVEEHSDIYRMSHENSIIVLESLLNAGLIAAHPVEFDRAERRIEIGRRYCMHPLLIGPVRAHLVGRHIVY